MQIGSKHHAAEPNVRIARCKQAAELAFGLRKRNRSNTATRNSCSLALGGVDQFAEFLRELSMTLTRLVRSKLRRHGEKALFISVDMASQQCNDVASSGHSLPSARPMVVIFDINVVMQACIEQNSHIPLDQQSRRSPRAVQFNRVTLMVSRSDPDVAAGHADAPGSSLFT